jgi:hypothetical protein
MRGKGKGLVWMGLVWCGAAACDQELVLPDRPTNPATDAPNEGFTGIGGAADETAPGSRLPVPGEPIFTTFGGAGGEAGSATERAGGKSGQGGAGPQKVGEGGRPSTAGASGSGGAKTDGVAGGAPTAGAAYAGTAGAAPGRTALLFSEYVEGSGSFKALEIYALEASSLEGCELQTYSNGKLEPSRLALHGQLGRGEVQVLCSSTLADAQPNACDRSTSLIFNGDDALALRCADRMLDVIGQIGIDPGDSWDLGATLDHTLRRRCDVLVGRSDGSAPFAVDAEWLTLGVDTFTDLGVRNCAP